MAAVPDHGDVLVGSLGGEAKHRGGCGGAWRAGRAWQLHAQAVEGSRWWRMMGWDRGRCGAWRQ